MLRQRARWLAVLVVALGAGACADSSSTAAPRSLEEAIGRARAELRLSSPVEIRRWQEGGDVFVLYAADAVLDGVGLLIVEADPPWDRQFSGTGDISNAEIGGVAMAGIGNPDGTYELIVFGEIVDPRVSQVELDLGLDGSVTVPATGPGFARVLDFPHEVSFPRWRFLGRDGSTIYDPYE